MNPMDDRRDSNTAGHPWHVSSAWASALLAVILIGCASDQQKISAINSVNQGFRTEYEKLLAEKGARVYKVPRADAFLAMRVALAGLGMRTERQDLALGHLAVAAKAPLPLSDEEWKVASQADLPLLQRLIEPHVGIVANFVHFEPQGLEVVINAAVLEVAAGTEVSLTVRLREIAPPRSGWPRREYVAPHVLEVGLEKIFGAFEQELRAGARP
ncbi:MAG: hypothetical protein OEW27_04405 [Aquincola sp.]|nr:hypothetical protein [Aquincola sp.]MDH5329167.1 hypothetical protein [Aquincola sp.]